MMQHNQFAIIFIHLLFINNVTNLVRHHKSTRRLVYSKLPKGEQAGDNFNRVPWKVNSF